MCGIHVSVSSTAFQPPSTDLRQLLSKRGPDHLAEAQSKIVVEGGVTYFVSLTSTVLALRGGQVRPQPFHDSASGCSLCWNGEAWRVASSLVTGNDGQMIFELLCKASSVYSSAADSISAVLTVLRGISGPFAFVFLDGSHGLLYFGRDRLGRRSLLYNSELLPGTVALSSCADSANRAWKEVEADGIYQISLRDQDKPIEGVNGSDMLSTFMAGCQRHLWMVQDSSSPTSSLGKFNRELPLDSKPLNCRSPSVEQLRWLLNESLKLRILNVPTPPKIVQCHNVRVAVLFSGGLDCTVLARMAHDMLPPDQEIDLLNVAFENPRSIRAAKITTQSKKQRSSSPLDSAYTQSIGHAVEDSTTSPSCYELCPDRQTGRRAFRELRTVCPGRIWRFIAVDVPYEETLSHRERVVGLISPHNTEMDLSIAYALYFASRGTGLASTSDEYGSVKYSTPARVLLSGLGADELFGGYTRHTTAFRRNGFPALLDELELDVNRLGKRNLGRDDRVISYWSREARFPYLDENFVEWAVERPVWEKCGFREGSTEHAHDSEDPRIDPEKKVLRLLAYELGMHSVAVEKKRAVRAFLSFHRRLLTAMQ
ncbi:asparagine synthase-domain-containing protein [Amylocarpus encephaloides]|uniref:Asparagine synthase-domain-containing protein n=1 Tax=Amylocarpus encephaloides TaxID=45428 RepID=A0A9P8C0D5_9HELO|nr:asparagine synthase-domain-containing protein [Amylocarpus encephaloides]